MNHVEDSRIPAPTEASWGFAEDHRALTENEHQAHNAAVQAGLTPISPGVAAVLTTMAKAINARHVIEIGTELGSSALPLLAGMAADGVLTSIDGEADHQLPARSLLQRAGYLASRARLIAGLPLEVLPKLRDGAYDILFVNGDKLEYVEYVAAAQRLLRPGGMLIVNDALWHNTVADPDSDGDETIIIREALEAVRAAACYTTALLPVGNGLLIAVKD